MPEFIQELKTILSTHSVLIDIEKSLHLLFTRTIYGCEKHYPVAIVHERRRIKEAEAEAYFKANMLFDEEGLSYEEYPYEDLEKIALYTEKYIQNVGYMLFSTKEIIEPVFKNKFKHDFWKKIHSIGGLEAVIDISVLKPETTICQAEDSLRAIIRKRKEVHQLKKIPFVWIVKIDGQNPTLSIVLKHYFQDNILEIKNSGTQYYVAWSNPLQDINMRYFVCPPA